MTDEPAKNISGGQSGKFASFERNDGAASASPAETIL